MRERLLRLRGAVFMLPVLGAVLALYVAGFAQSKKDAQDHHEHDFAELAKVPPKARARVNPLQGDPEAVAAGEKLFQQHCAECHGESAEGTDRAPSLRAEEVRNATPGMLFWILTNGVVRRGMPVWSKLPEARRWQIVSYLKSLPAPGPGEPAGTK